LPCSAPGSGCMSCLARPCSNANHVRDVLHRLLNRRTRGGPASSSLGRTFSTPPTQSPQVSSEPPGSVTLAHHGVPNSHHPPHDPAVIKLPPSGIRPDLLINTPISNSPLPTGPTTS
jgi:hypothetical protein